jgi:hypothetical protein
MSIKRFTPARLRIAMVMLAEYPFGSYDIALARLSETFGFDVTGPALGKAFEQAGLSSPENYMADSTRSHCRTCRCRMRK